MHSIQIFWPVMAVLIIPIVVLLLNAKRKAADRASGEIKPETAIDNKAWSLPVILSSNSLANQFQLPVVFYVLCFILYSINSVTTSVLILCWVFVLSRWVHAVIHVTSNVVAWRMRFFIVGAVTLFILFGVTVYSLVLAS